MFPFFSLIIFVGMINFGQSFRHSLSRRNPVKFRRPLYSKATNTPDFSKEITSKYFDFCSAEEKIYRWWESQNYFKPIEKKGEKPFVIPMPPPNVTGYLHMGHAIFVALQDIMTRYHRMRGRPTLWLPGTDHAGIATQLLVERQLAAKGQSRQKLGREAFVEEIWKWKEDKGSYITNQMKRLGASADWSREKFTLDPKMSFAVSEAFIRLHKKGLIYKGTYLVNWSPNLQTAVSDLEVDYSEEVGKLYYFKYFLEGEDEFIPVATTRPETILGDSAVCVNPNDVRYQSLIGKNVIVPILGRVIPVIGDDYVDSTFGTGALKVTPAHDANDYELGKRHNLTLINVMNKDATINSNGGKYAGLDRFECRDEIWNDITKAGLAIKVDNHVQRVPRSQRGGEIIEPLVSSQWFVRMNVMSEKAITAVKSGEITIKPERFEKVFYNWLENIHDWCISRQLWWGHRIPVYYLIDEDGNPTEEYIVAHSEDEAILQAKSIYGSEVRLAQDEDVLDTWFSSGLWPFSTVGWPQDAIVADSDYSKFYPATVLETGYDILFFWVARMVMMGLELTEKVPFRVIYMHGLVRDGEGQKMSKTKGNVIDPIDTIDKFGCDALRFSLVTGATPGQDVPLSLEKIESNRNFVNKLWNVGKFIQNCLSTSTDLEFSSKNFVSDTDLKCLSLSEKFIISKCHSLVKQVTLLLENYDFSDAGRAIYDFLWDDFADWYIEASKIKLKNGNEMDRQNVGRVLVYVWDTCLKLLHPFMPYLTEVLWQNIPHQGESLMIAQWPLMQSRDALIVDSTAVDSFIKLQSTVRAIRNIRAEYNVDVNKKLEVILRINSAMRDIFEQEKDVFCALSKVEKMVILDNYTKETDTVHVVVEDGLEVFIPQTGLVDKEKEVARLSKQSKNLRKDIAVLEGRLNNPGFRDKAPKELVDDASKNLKELKEQLKVIDASLNLLVL